MDRERSCPEVDAVWRSEERDLCDPEVCPSCRVVDRDLWDPDAVSLLATLDLCVSGVFSCGAFTRLSPDPEAESSLGWGPVGPKFPAEDRRLS